MQSKGVGKFCSNQLGCNKRLDLLAVDVLNGFYCMYCIIANFGLLNVNCYKC